MTKKKTPRAMSLVRFNFTGIPEEIHCHYPFTSGGTYVFLGEIPNMPDHCVVACHSTGQIFSGYHTVGFCEMDQNRPMPRIKRKR